MESLVHAAPTRVRKRLELSSPESCVAFYAAYGSARPVIPARPTMEERRIDDAEVVSAAARVSVDALAECALASRSLGEAARAPALLCALLSHRDPDALAAVFPRVINTPSLVRRFVGIVRSGVSGRRSLGSAPKRLIVRWLGAQSDDDLVTHGAKLRDVIRLSHPRPRSRSRAALFRFVLSRPHDVSRLPRLARALSGARRGGSISGLTLALCRDKRVGRRESREYLPLLGKTNANELISLLEWFGAFADEELVIAIGNRLSEVAADNVRSFAWLRTLRAGRLPPEWLDAGFGLLDRATQRGSVGPSRDLTLLVDTSASMSAPLYAPRGDERDPIDGLDVAALLIAELRQPGLRVHDFAGTPLHTSGSVGELRERLGRRVTPSQTLATALERSEGRVGDHVAVTDDVGFVGALAQRGSLRGEPRCWLVDLCPTSKTSAGPQTVRFAGFSDACFSLIAQRGSRSSLARFAS